MSQEHQTIDSEFVDSPTLTENSAPQNRRDYLLNDSSIFYKGLFGMILCIVPAAIIGLVLIKMSLEESKGALKEYTENPRFYQPNSVSMVKRGRIFAYIGLGLFIVELVALMTYMSMI